jgi:hypothetical protein
MPTRLQTHDADHGRDCNYPVKVMSRRRIKLLPLLPRKALAHRLLFPVRADVHIPSAAFAGHFARREPIALSNQMTGHIVLRVPDADYGHQC